MNQMTSELFFYLWRFENFIILTLKARYLKNCLSYCLVIRVLEKCCMLSAYPLRKHAYWNILKILPPKNEKKSDKKSDIFHISAQNIDYGHSLEPPRRGGSNEYPQSMFLRRNKKNNVYPCKLQFYYIKVGFKGVNII